MEKPEKITFEQLPDAVSYLIGEVSLLKQLMAQKPAQTKQAEEEYFTPSEMAQSLKVSMVTLWNWDKQGITNPLRIGNLKRYRKSDLERILVEINRKKELKGL